MSNMIGIGIVGCGVISGTHITAIKKVKDARLVAVCDTDGLDPKFQDIACQAFVKCGRYD